MERTIGKDNLGQIILVEITDQQRKEAAITCAQMASDRDELRMFLSQLGLVERLKSICT